MVVVRLPISFIISTVSLLLLLLFYYFIVIIIILYRRVYNAQGLKTERIKTAEMTRAPECHQ